MVSVGRRPHWGKGGLTMCLNDPGKQSDIRLNRLGKPRLLYEMETVAGHTWAKLDPVRKLTDTTMNGTTMNGTQASRV